MTAVLDGRNIDARSELRLACADDAGVHAVLRIGAQDAVSSVQRLSQDQLFLSYDTSAFPAGCSLEATLDNGAAGRSQPFALARLIRLPHILSVVPAANATTTTNGSEASVAPAGLRRFEITGENLEMIGKLSWDQNLGVDVAGVPAAIPGQGQRQSLIVELPDAPGVGAPLYVWLRGESASRTTTVTQPATSANAARASSPSPLVR